MSKLASSCYIDEDVATGDGQKVQQALPTLWQEKVHQHVGKQQGDRADHQHTQERGSETPAQNHCLEGLSTSILVVPSPTSESDPQD